MQKILIVDDKEQNLFTLEKVLADLKVEFVRATNGNDALKATLYDDFALAILDVQMPEMDGYELAELLRSDVKTANLPVIFLSAVYHDDYHIFKGYDSGAVDFIIKPYEPKILVSKVNFFLQLHQQKIALLKTVEIEKAKNYLENILYSMADMVLVVGSDLCIKTCNQGGLSLLGFDQEEIVGKPLDLLFAEEKYSSWVRHLPTEKNSAQELQVLQNKETTLLTREEGDIPVLVSVSPIYDTFEKLYGAVFVARDLRERKQLEEQVDHAKRMESIGLMASGVAHDLNNILSGIVGYPELLLNDLPSDSELRGPIEAIRDSGQRAALVVADLLTVARGAACTKEVHNLNSLIQEYLDSPENKKLKSLYPNIKCQHQLEATQANIFCSQVHVKKSLMNLITNAAEIIVNHGEVLVSTYNQCITDTNSSEHNMERGEYVVLSVRDTGSGISNTDLEHIFEPFYTKKVMGRSGTGLGLTVVWNTINDHDGTIFVDSSDKGTCFQLYFPVVHEKETIKNESIKKERYIGHNEHILVVDDEPQLRDLASRMLQTLGYNVDSVCSGEMAIKFVKETPVDLIMLDMVMEPGMTGRQTYEEIIKLYPDQKAIVASGFSESEDVKATMRLGASGFTKKPYSMEQLGRAVKEVLKT